MIFNEQLVIMDCEATDSSEVISQLCTRMEQHGMVKETYKAAVIKREEEFPTGIPTAFYDIAIPHAPSSHVINPGIAIAYLRNDVKFYSMGAEDELLSPKIVILLAIKDPQAQLTLLRNLMGAFEDEQLMTELLHAKNVGDVVDVVSRMEILNGDEG